MSILDKVPERVKGNDESEFCLGECSFQGDYPGIWEFLARQRYKGENRQTGKLVLFTEPGKATVCLIDRQTGQVSFFTSEALDEAFLGCEKALQSGNLDWRKDKRATYRR